MNKLIRKIIAGQFCRPSGLLGYYAANGMKKNNLGFIAHVCDLLDVQDNDVMLEIGCGAGYAIELIMNKNSRCSIDAIDFSHLMLKKTEKRNRKPMADGRVRLFKGDFGDYDFGKSAYSKIFAVNVIYFWKDLNAQFSKIFSLLKPHGRLFLFMASPEWLKKHWFDVDDVFHKHTIDEVEASLLKTGFKKVTYEKVVRAGFTPLVEKVWSKIGLKKKTDEKVVKTEFDTFYIIAEKP